MLWQARSGGGCAGPRGVKKIAAVAVGQRLQLSRGGGGGWGRLGLGVAGDGGSRQAEAALGVGAFAAGGQQVGVAARPSAAFRARSVWSCFVRKTLSPCLLAGAGQLFVGFGIHAYNAAVPGLKNSWALALRQLCGPRW